MLSAPSSGDKYETRSSPNNVFARLGNMNNVAGLSEQILKINRLDIKV